MSTIIGEDVRVAAAKNSLLVGTKGKVVLESMHTLTIRTGARNLTIPKAGSALELSTGKLLLGDDLEGRLEDRIAASFRPGGKRRRAR